MNNDLTWMCKICGSDSKAHCDITKHELHSALDRLKEAHDEDMRKISHIVHLEEECEESTTRIEFMEKELKLLEQCKNDHKALVDRLAFLRQRKDLPLDRIPAYKKFCALQDAARKFCNKVETGGTRSVESYGIFKRALGDWDEHNGLVQGTYQSRFKGKNKDT